MKYNSTIQLPGIYTTPKTLFSSGSYGCVEKVLSGSGM
jgi:hypothetical protein